MTCIVGIAHKGQVFMGGDSCASDSETWQNVSNPKIFSIGDRFLIGGAGSFRMIDLLRFSLIIPAHPNSISVDAFMRTKFVATVRRTLEKNRLDENDINEFLVGYAGRLFVVQTDYSVLNVANWGYAIGAGEGPARGSLWTTRLNPDINERIRQALEAAEATTLSVRSPFNYETI